MATVNKYDHCRDIAIKHCSIFTAREAEGAIFARMCHSVEGGVSQHAPGQGVCIPACTWAGGCVFQHAPGQRRRCEHRGRGVWIRGGVWTGDILVQDSILLPFEVLPESFIRKSNLFLV